MGSLITDKVRQIVRMRGPVIPSQISKEIGTNILMASAILGELASSSDVKISSVKFGGTPLYYVAGQEAKLQNYIAGLPQKEKEAFEQLKSAGVLADNALEPAIRVALRQIKDFAKPIEASHDGGIQLFWKWFLLSNEQAEAAVKKIMGITEQPVPVQQQQAQAPSSQIEHVIKPQTTLLQPEPKPTQQKIQKPKPASLSPNEFSKSINEFFAKNSIEVVSEGIVKKIEAEHVVLLPSPVGKLKYLCISKNKKTCTDSDISSAIVQGQLKKLPILLLTKGELTKKAQELLSQEIVPVVVHRI